MSEQQGKLVCFASLSFSRFFLSLSLFQRGTNGKDRKRGDGMLVSDKEDRVAGYRGQV